MRLDNSTESILHNQSLIDCRGFQNTLPCSKKEWNEMKRLGEMKFKKFQDGKTK